MRKTIMVTGGAGMIGSNLVNRLVADNCKVIVVDNLWRGRRENLLDHDGMPVIDMDKDFHMIDLSIPGIIDNLLEGVDFVYHLADVVAGIDYVFRNQGAVFRQNLLINSNVISSVREKPIKGFLYVGTACSFPAEKQSGVEARPLIEEDQYPAAPESAYGWSKLMGEYEALLMERETGIPVSVIILHNVYGTPCDFSPERSQVIPSLVRKAVRYPNEPFIVWGSGKQGRAFVHVNDVIQALVYSMEKGLSHGTIQIGPSICTTIREIAKIVVGISGKDIDIQYDMGKPEGDCGRCADYSKAKRILGWEPRVKLREGLTKVYEWIESKISN